MFVSGYRIAQFVECNAALDLLPMLGGLIVDVCVLISASNVMSFDANECSAVWAVVSVVSEAPFLGTGHDWNQTTTDEAECTEYETHDPRKLAWSLTDLCCDHLLALVCPHHTAPKVI